MTVERDVHNPLSKSQPEGLQHTWNKIRHPHCGLHGSTPLSLAAFPLILPLLPHSVPSSLLLVSYCQGCSHLRGLALAVPSATSVLLSGLHSNCPDCPSKIISLSHSPSLCSQPLSLPDVLLRIYLFIRLSSSLGYKLHKGPLHCPQPLERTGLHTVGAQ